jgi:hypothetical protein
MDTTTMLGGSRQRTDPPDPREAIEGQRASSGLRAAYLLSAVIAVLMVVASAAGLWLHRLYQDPAWATAAFRGGDLATLLVAAPLLAGALLRSLRGSRRAHLVGQRAQQRVGEADPVAVADQHPGGHRLL